MDKKQIIQEFRKKFVKEWRSDKGTYYGILTTFEQDNLEEWLSNKLDEVEKQERAICREIYIEGVDWAEWSISDEEAGIDFDEVRMLKNNK